VGLGIVIREACLGAAVLALLCSSAVAQRQDELPFARVYSASGAVAGSLEEAAALAGVPPVAMVDALRAFATVLDIDRDVHDGDRFYVRYEEGFSLDGSTAATGRVLWADLALTGRKEPVAIFRFRPLGDRRDSFWLISGEGTSSPALRLPVDIVAMSSGFGPRSAPIEQPGPFAKGLPHVKVPAHAHTPLKGPGHAANGGVLLKPVKVMTVPRQTPGHSLVTGKYFAFGHRMELHDGVDFVAPPGTPIHAAGDGIVLGAEPRGGYGNWIEIEHEGGLSTVYGHLVSYAPGIEPGVRVERGDVIGYVGTTGRTTGPHVHFELHADGRPVDPMTNAAFKRPVLRGSDLERFRKLTTQSLANRDTAAALVSSSRIDQADNRDWNLIP
jgi:murein DD-endopeptidase MepM/ murein hydrolase activator NlpD